MTVIEGHRRIREAVGSAMDNIAENERSVPPREVPFAAHLDLLTAPVEGLSLDPVASGKPVVKVGDIVHVFRGGKCSEHRVDFAGYDPVPCKIGIEGVGYCYMDFTAFLNTEGSWHHMARCPRTIKEAA